jgi:2-keto-3-deoxy-6-phosphogluconate aldolase
VDQTVWEELGSCSLVELLIRLAKRQRVTINFGSVLTHRALQQIETWGAKPDVITPTANPSSRKRNE